MTLESGKEKLITTKELSGKLGKLDKEIKNSNKAEWNKEKKGAVSVGKDKNGAHVYSFTIPENYEGLNKGKIAIAKKLGIKNLNHFGIFSSLDGEKLNIVPKKGEKVYLKYVGDENYEDSKGIEGNKQKTRFDMLGSFGVNEGSTGSIYVSASDYKQLIVKFSEKDYLGKGDSRKYKVQELHDKDGKYYLITSFYYKTGVAPIKMLLFEQDATPSIIIQGYPVNKNPNLSTYDVDTAKPIYEDFKRAFLWN